MPQIKHTIIRGAGEFWAGAKFVTAARICRRILPPGFGLTCKLTCKLFLHPPSQCPAIYLQVCLPPPTCNIPASTCKPRRLGLTSQVWGEFRSNMFGLTCKSCRLTCKTRRSVPQSWTTLVVATVPSSERCTLQSLPGKTFTSDFALGTLVQHPRGGPELKLRQCLPNMVVFQSLVHARVTPGR